MEINVTEFIASQQDDLRYFSSSVFESGKTVAQDTWAHCMEYVEDSPLIPYQCSGCKATLTLCPDDEVWSCTACGAQFDKQQPPHVKNLDEVADHFRGYGAWDDEESDSWSVVCLQAMLVQECASAARQYEALGFDLSNDECEQFIESGDLDGRLYRGDDNQWYLYIGC